MSSPTTTELMNIAYLGQENFIPAAEEARPHTFLSLAPTTSASYPMQPKSTPKSPDQSPADAGKFEEVLKTRRSSSLGSDASGKRRFLKLGPVHFGEGDGKGDWSEDVLAE